MLLLHRKAANRWVVLKQSFLALFLTFSLMELSNVGASLIDGLIVSNFLDAEAMAAIGIAHPVFSIAGIFSGMIATGMQTVCSQELGRGNVREFNRLFSAALYVGAVFSILLTAAAFLGAAPFASFLGASGKGASLVKPAAQYLRGVGLGLPALILTAVVASAIQMDSGRTRAMAGAVIYSVLNILFDFVAVGLKTGMFGIGFATSVAQYLELAYLFLHFRKTERMLRLTRWETSPREMLRLLSCGTEKALRRVGSVLRPLLVNKMIIFYGGTVAMSAMSVRSGLCDFAHFFAIGLADAVALLGGVFFGEMNDEALREMGNCAHRNCALYCGAVCALLLIFSKPIARFYISEEGELLNMTVFAVRMIALQTPLNGLLRPRITYLQAVQKTRNMQLLTMCSSLVYVVVSAFALGRLFGAYGILSCFLLSDFLCLATVWAFYAARHKKLLPTPEDYLSLPENFRRGPGDVISLDIRDMEDVSLVSQQIGMFCKGHRIDKKIGFAASVCFEELAVNIIRHGFPKCAKEPGMDLRLVYHERELILRLQDNCPAFDVQKQIAVTLDKGADDLENQIGMRILRGMASNISYVHSLETNNVILRFALTEKA